MLWAAEPFRGRLKRQANQRQGRCKHFPHCSRDTSTLQYCASNISWRYRGIIDAEYYGKISMEIEELNDIPFDLTETDRQNLAEGDEAFRPHTWEELKDIIGMIIFEVFERRLTIPWQREMILRS